MSHPTTQDIRLAMTDEVEDLGIDPTGVAWIRHGAFEVAYAAEDEGGATWTVYERVVRVDGVEGGREYVTTDGDDHGSAKALADAIAAKIL